MSKLKREIISRCAMGLLALGLLYGAVKLIRVGSVVQEEMMQMGTRRRATRPAFALVIPGGGLGLLGGAFGLAAILPTRIFARIMGPPTNTTLWERPDTDRWHHW